MRYVGQEYTVNVPIDGEIDLAPIEGDFHDAHRVRHGHSTPGAPVEFVNVRLAAMGRIGARDAPYQPPPEEHDPLLGRRRVLFAGEPHETDVLLRDHLRPGTRHEGPLVIEEQSSTTVVPPAYVIDVDDLGNLLVTKL